MEIIDTQTLLHEGALYTMNTYAQLPVILTGGKGTRVFDSEGNSYLDFVAGIAVNALGYGNPIIKQAITEVLDGGLTHCSNLYWNIPAIQTAGKLVTLSGLDKTFFCNSGAEANEAALKLARKYGHLHKGPDCNQIITMKHKVHGRTYGAVTATGQEKYHKGFAPMMPDFAYAEFNNLESVKKIVSSRTCAILVEPVQGEGGIIPARKEFLEGLRELCDIQDILLIFDEVQCGMGRLGTVFGYQSYGVVPDAVTLAKGLGGGVAIGAMVANAKAAKAFTPGDHASTFGGNLLATAAAGAVLDELYKEEFLASVNVSGNALKTGLENLKTKYPELIVDVRGQGLMLGIELSKPAKPIIEACMESGLLLVGAGVHIIRFVPPLIVSQAEVQEAVSILDAVIASL